MKAIASKSRSPRAAEKAAPRTRTARPYPAWTFEQALPLAEAIQKFASGERVSRLTLFKQLDKSPTSSSSQNLVTNSAKYGLTTGSYVAEYLELTEEGKTLTFPGTPEEEKLSLTYQLSIARVRPFAVLYERFKGKRLPAHEVLSDVLKESDIHTQASGSGLAISHFRVRASRARIGVRSCNVAFSDGLPRGQIKGELTRHVSIFHWLQHNLSVAHSPRLTRNPAIFRHSN